MGAVFVKMGAVFVKIGLSINLTYDIFKMGAVFIKIGLSINLTYDIFKHLLYYNEQTFRAVRILNAGFNDKKNIHRFTH